MQVEIDEETYEVLQRIKQIYRVLRKKEITENQILGYLIFDYVDKFLENLEIIEKRC